MAGTSQDIIRECNENFVGGMETVADFAASGIVEHHRGFVIVKTGILLSDFNEVFALEGPVSVDALKEAITRLLVKTRTPWRLVTVADTVDNLKPVIDAFDLVYSTKEPGMILDPLPQSNDFAIPSDFVIKEVSGKDELSALIATSAAGFDTPIEVWSKMKEVFESAIRNPSYKGASYVGYVKDVPVGTSLRYTSGRTAGIYLVTVLQEFRRRGFGEALTWRALLDGKKEGCTMGYLQSSEMGLSVYKRMGFRTVVEYQVWEPRRTQE